MELNQVLHLRKSCRGYLPTPLTDEEVNRLLEAAQTAPLARGDDLTTHITVLRDPAIVEEIRREVVTVSRKTGLDYDPLWGATTLFFLSATDISEDHIEYSNVACVIENMLLQATEMGLGSTYIWGCLRKLRAHPETIAKLGLPEGYEILSAMAVGHPKKPLEPREPKDKMQVNFI